MSGLRYRIAYVPWWNPVRLAQRHENGFDFIGWVWRTKARQVKNLHYGWIAFVEDQTPERLACCPHCDRPMDEATKCGLARWPDDARKPAPSLAKLINDAQASDNARKPAPPTPEPPFPPNRLR